MRDMAHETFLCYRIAMENNTQNYIARLRAVGMRLDNATVLVNDFLRDLDWDGLADYCATLERRHELAQI